MLIFVDIVCADGTAPEEEWNKIFGGTVSYENSVQQTTDGGYIIAGTTEPYGPRDADFWLVKTDSNGIEQWNKIFGGTNRDPIYSVQQTTDGGYIIAGTTMSYGAGRSDFWLVKTDSNGNEQWNKTFGGTGWDCANSVQQTTDGGYIIAGSMNWKNEWVGEESEAGTTITTNELQDIIHHWLEGISVHEHIISISDLQEMIDIWLSG